MSYVRLLRLPPQFEAVGATRCWRRQLSARGGRPNNLRDDCAELYARHVFLRGDDTRRRAGRAIGQGAVGGRRHGSRNDVAGHYAGEKTGKGTASSTCTSGPALTACDRLDARPSTVRAPLVHSTGARAPWALWGATGTGTHPGGAWGDQQAQWRLLRAFSSVPPEQQDSKMDAPDHHHARKTFPGQRVFVGGLLKPSDKEIEPVKDESAQRFKDLQEEYKLYEAARKDPKHTSEQVEQSQMALTRKKAVAMVKRVPVATWDATKALALFLWEIIRNPTVLKDKLVEAQYHLKEFGRHYWLGCKLLWSDIKTAKKIIKRMLRGFPMTRRERKQLLRTASDIFRMVPLAAFVLIPFMEFLLPVALRIFPGMLPSTFQDSLKEEEKLKKELRLRMAYAGFLQETVTAMAVKKKTRAEDGEESEATTGELTEFIEKAKMGEITNQDIPKFAKMFKDELTMDNISRSGLVNMCRYMGLPPFGNDNFLRFQLRSKLRAITQDDQRILWEGVSSLTKQELQEACRERGMRATGLTKQGYVRQLSQWLDLSTKKSVPISLLIMSRAFTLQAPDPARALAQSISAMDEDVVTEVMIEAASSEEQQTPEYRTRKLESLTRQNELIEEENRKREEAKKAQEAKKAGEAKKAQDMKAAEMEDAVGVSTDDVLAKADTTAETSEDRAVNKVIAEAAIEAAARTSQSDTSPGVTMREGQQQFIATPETGAKKASEPLTTEADIVSPAKGVGAGDRLVDPKQAKPKAAKRESAAAKAKAELDQRAQELTDAVQQLSDDSQGEDGSAEDGGNKLTAAELDALESLASPSSVEKEKAQLAMMKAALQESLGKPDEANRTNAKATDRADSEGAVVSAVASSAPEKEDMVPSSTADQMSANAEQAAPEMQAQTAPDANQEEVDSQPDVLTADTAQPAGNTAETQDAAKAEDAKAGEPAVDKTVQRVQTKLASMLNRLELEIQSVEKRIGDKMHVLDRDKDGMVTAEEITYVVQHVLTAASTAQEAKAIAEEMDTDSDGQISVAELIAWVKKHSEKDPEDVFNELYQRSAEDGSTKSPPKD